MTKRSSSNETEPKKPRLDVEEAAEEDSVEKVPKREKRRQRLMESPTGELTVTLTPKWAELLKKETTTDRAKELSQEIHSVVETHYVEVGRTKRGSRIVQSVIKFGDNEIRQTIISELTGHFVDFCRKSCTRHIISRLIQHCNKTLIAPLLVEVLPESTTLIKNLEGARILQDLFNSMKYLKKQLTLVVLGKDVLSICELEQLDPLKTSLKDILEKRPLRKEEILKRSIDNMAIILSKGIGMLTLVQTAFWSLVSCCSPSVIRASVVPLVKDHFIELLESSFGRKVLIQCIRCGTARDRRTFVKKVKGKAAEIACTEEVYIVILALIACTDDTSLVNKHILSEILPHVETMFTSKYGSTVLKFLVAGRAAKSISPPILESFSVIEIDEELSSKKDEDIRCKEVQQIVAEPILTCIQTNFLTYLAHPIAQYVILEAVSHLEADLLKETLPELLKEFDIEKITSSLLIRPVKRLFRTGVAEVVSTITNIVLTADLTPFVDNVDVGFFLQAIVDFVKDADEKLCLKLRKRIKKQGINLN
ncbi:hypothetical protein GEMRC1_002279 [Eukaryota sp. GEM-RC1]